MSLGLSGRIARSFQASQMTPLLALVALLMGIFATLVTPREEEPQIDVTMANVFVPFPGASAKDVENLVASPAEQVLIERLDSAPDDPAVCQAIVDSGVTHVLDFGLQSVHTYDIHAPGLDELAGSPRLRELFRQGPAVLYEVVGCS